MARLTIPDEQTFATFTATAQTVFPVSFALLSGKVDLRVSVAGIELGQSDFTFSGTLLDGGGYQGGVVTLNTAATGEVIIWRDVTAQRASQFAPTNSVPVGSIDGALNRAMALLQDLRRDSDRSLKAEFGASIPSPSDVIAAAQAVAQKADKVALFTVNYADFTGNAAQRLQACHDALPATGGVINIPPNIVMDLTATVAFTKPNIKLRKNGSKLSLSFANGDGITVEGADFECLDWNDTATVTRTGGRTLAIVANAHRARVIGYTEKQFYAVDIDGPRCWSVVLAANNGAANGAYVRLGKNLRTGEGSVVLVNDPFPTVADAMEAGILLHYTDDISVSGSKILKCNANIKLAPGTGQTCALTKGVNLNLDTAVNAVKVAPTGTGAVIRSSFAGWFGAMSGNIFDIAAPGSTSVAEFDIVSGYIRSGVYGVSATGAVTNLRIGSQIVFATLTRGISIGSGVGGKIARCKFESDVTTRINNSSTAFYVEEEDWTTVTGLTVSAVSGTITTSSASLLYRRNGKSVEIRLDVSITTNGTGAAALQVSGLPFAATSSTDNLVGVERGATGHAVVGQVDNAGVVTIRKYDGSYAGGNGYSMRLSGTIQLA